MDRLIEKLWCIRNKKNHSLMWCNEWGWVEGEEQIFSVFTEKEKAEFDLPLEGEWQEW